MLFSNLKSLDSKQEKKLVCWLPCQRSAAGPCGICVCCRSQKQTPCWCMGWCKPSGISCMYHSGYTLWRRSGSCSLWWMQVQLKGGKRWTFWWQNLHTRHGCRVMSRNKYVPIVAHIRLTSACALIIFSLTEYIPVKCQRAVHPRCLRTLFPGWHPPPTPAPTHLLANTKTLTSWFPHLLQLKFFLLGWLLHRNTERFSVSTWKNEFCNSAFWGWIEARCPLSCTNEWAVIITEYILEPWVNHILQNSLLAPNKCLEMWAGISGRLHGVPGSQVGQFQY